MNASQRVVLNTVATYGRSLFAVALMLFSSRWVLNALGNTDFGLFSVVGSIIILITFLKNTMAGSVARFYAFSIGQGKSSEVTQWFNIAISIHLCLGIVFVAIGLPIGGYAIKHLLTIPENRVVTCLWVFRVSLCAAIISIITIPCAAMFIAQQRITETAFWGMIQAVLVFGLAFLVSRLDGDLLLIYAVGMASIIVLIQTLVALRAFSIFKECRLHFQYWNDIRRFKRILSFAAWNFIGAMGTTLRDQGSAILLNVYFGPSVNSAFGISKQVSAQGNQLATAMLGAFAPEITASEGRGDRYRMLRLAMKASKYGTMLVLIFAVPLIVEMDYILKLWLKTPPVYCAIFCRLILISFMIDRLSSGFMLAVHAHGRIAKYQATLGAGLVLTLPLAWLFLYLGCEPPWVCVAFVITTILCSFGRVLWVRSLLGVSPRDWLKAVVTPNVLIAMISLATAYLTVVCLPESVLRVISVMSMSITVSMLASWFLVLETGERDFMVSNCRLVLRKWNLLKHKGQSCDSI